MSTPSPRLDHDRRQRRQLRRLPGAAAGRPRAGPAAAAGDLRRQRAHPQRGRAVRAGRLRGAGARCVLAASSARLDIGYDAEDSQRGRALAMAADRAALQRDLADAAAALRARPEVQRPRRRRHRLLHGRPAGLHRRRHGRRRRGGGLLRRRHPGQAGAGAAHRLPDPVPLRRARRQHPAEAVDAVRAALAGKPAELYVYAGADHGFNCWARGSYHAASAALALGRACSSWPRGCSEQKEKRRTTAAAPAAPGDHREESQPGDHRPLQHDQRRAAPHPLPVPMHIAKHSSAAQQQAAEHQAEDHHAGASSAKPGGARDSSSKLTVSQAVGSASSSRSSLLFSAWPLL